MVSFFLAKFIAQTMTGYISTNLPMLLTRYGESVCNPAKGIDNMHRYRAIVNASNWITLNKYKNKTKKFIIYLQQQYSYSLNAGQP